MGGIPSVIGWKQFVGANLERNTIIAAGHVRKFMALPNGYPHVVCVFIINHHADKCITIYGRNEEKSQRYRKRRTYDHVEFTSHR